MMYRPFRGLLSALALGAAACGGAASASGNDAEAQPTEEIRTVVDSVFPIEEEIARFRATIEKKPAVLSGGSSTRQELVQRLIGALAVADTAALREMTLDRAEFGYLYYPYTQYTRKPYELSPALVWFQVQNYGSRGLVRALDGFGGREITYVYHECGSQPMREGPNTIWHGCVVRIATATGDTVTASLFDSILERDGHLKFVSYSNRLKRGAE